jgi:hypothetical protein
MKGEQTSLQLRSRSYRLAALDADFLLGESMGEVRSLLELSRADEMLRDAGVRSALVVRGSARVRENASAHEVSWYAQARQFGRIASGRGGAQNAEAQVSDIKTVTGGRAGARPQAAFLHRTLSPIIG